MKRTALYIILFLAIPALCQASYGPSVLQDLCGSGLSNPGSYLLELEQKWLTDSKGMGAVDLSPHVIEPGAKDLSLEAVSGGISSPSRDAPVDMVSMMSFLWSEMFGGVDIVAEVREFARKVRNRGRYVKLDQQRTRDTRRRWKLTLSYRIDSQTEISALYENRGSFFGNGDVGLQISALDPGSQEVGLKMAYSDGFLDIRADRMTLTERAEAKVVVKF